MWENTGAVQWSWLFFSLSPSLCAVIRRERGGDAQWRSEITFQKPEALEEVCANEGVAEIEQKPAEEHPVAADVDWVRAGTHIAYGHLKQKGKRAGALLR